MFSEGSSEDAADEASGARGQPQTRQAQEKCLKPSEMQRYLAHKKPPPPWDRHRTLRIFLLQGPRGRRFLMSEVPLYGGRRCVSVGELQEVYKSMLLTHEYLAPTKTPTLLGPPQDPRHRPTVGS